MFERYEEPEICDDFEDLRPLGRHFADTSSAADFDSLARRLCLEAETLVLSSAEQSGQKPIESLILDRVRTTAEALVNEARREAVRLVDAAIVSIDESLADARAKAAEADRLLEDARRDRNAAWDELRLAMMLVVERSKLAVIDSDPAPIPVSGALMDDRSAKSIGTDYCNF